MKTYWVHICFYTNILMIWGLFCPQMSFAQANLVMNPSFEAYSPCTTAWLLQYSMQTNWFVARDTNLSNASQGKYILFQTCNFGTANPLPSPHNYYSGQMPRTGNGISYITTYSEHPFYYFDYQTGNIIDSATSPWVINYTSKLSTSLQNGKNYCVNIWWSTPKTKFVSDNLGILFHHGQFDSLTCSASPIPATPQILWNGGLLMDTVHWNKFGGIVQGNGETNLLVSGFKAFEDINFALLEPFQHVDWRAGLYIDDVSVIPQDLPAWAGNDTLVYPYDSVWVGRPWEVGLDENEWVEITANGDSALALGAGIWQQFSPGTHTLVVRQDLCGVVTRDTVVITADQTASRAIPWQKHISIGPNPSTGSVFVQTSEPIQIKVYDLSGKCILEKNIQNPTEISLKNWSSGLYLFECTAAGKPGIFSQKIIKE